MTQNSYEGVLEPWKVELIQQRARAFGIRGHDLEDAQQDIAIELLKFRFAPEDWPGASEAQVLTAVIDRQLAMICRKNKRYRARLEQYAEKYAPSELVPSPAEQLDLASDVGEAVAGLAPDERAVCAALAEGQTVNEIAKHMNLDWHTIQQRVQKIREHFGKLGISAAAPSPETNGHALLTAGQAAARCGKTARTWRTWDAAGAIPRPVRIGRSLLWRADELRDWIAAGCPDRATWDALR